MRGSLQHQGFADDEAAWANDGQAPEFQSAAGLQEEVNRAAGILQHHDDGREGRHVRHRVPINGTSCTKD